jgi:hypothetical protein
MGDMDADWPSGKGKNLIPSFAFDGVDLELDRSSKIAKVLITGQLLSVFKSECQRFDLKTATIAALIPIVKELVYFRTNEKSKVPTGRERNETLRALAKSAKSLVWALNAVMIDGQCYAIDLLMSETSRDGEAPIRSGAQHLGQLQMDAAFVAHVVDNYLKLNAVAAQDSGKKRKTLSVEARILKGAYEVLLSHGHKCFISKNGLFHRVANAMYAAAEMNQESLAAGAVNELIASTRAMAQIPGLTHYAERLARKK